MNRLLSHSRLRRYTRGQFVSSERETDEVLLVVSGHLSVGRARAKAPRAIVGVLGPTRVAGIARALDDAADEFFDYVSIDDSQVIHIPSGVLLSVLDQHVSLWRDVAIMVFREDRQTVSSLLEKMSGPLHARLAGTLARLATLYGKESDGELRISFRLTQEDLATMLQVARQSVNRQLQRLDKQGLISIDYTTVTVTDVKALRLASMAE